MSPVLAAPSQASQGPAEIQVLFAQARRRRRIRRAGLAVSLMLAIGASTLAVTFALRPAVPPGSRPGAAKSAGHGRGAPRSPLVAWFDANSRLHVGDMATGEQRVLAVADAYPSTQLAAADGRVYWVNVGNSFQFVQDVDLATGKIQNLGFGQSVFSSAGGRSVFIAEANSITEVPAARGAARRQLTPPSGWYLPGGDGTGGPTSPPMAVADGVLVESSYFQATPAPVTLGYWNLQTGQVTVLGKVTSADYGIIGAITAPGVSYGLAAWVPPGCRTWCAIRIASTTTGVGPTLRSPLRYGFALGGAFSPDGRRLAVFVNRTPGAGGETVQLAIASTTTGRLRLVPKVRVVVGAPSDWVRWLPGGRQLIVGSQDGSYLVTAATGAARPFNFFHSATWPINTSAVIMPRQ